jgi:signal transduction histidine kinase
MGLLTAARRAITASPARYPVRAARAERVIAITRVSLAAFSIFAIWLDPAEPTRYEHVTYILHSMYVAYSVVLAIFVWRLRHLDQRLAIAVHGIDIVAFSVFQYLTLGPSSPFFVYFVFALFSGTIRWGWRGALGTMPVVLAFFLVMGLSMSRTMGEQFELNRFVIRIGYLVMVGALLVYLGRYEARLRAEIELLARWPPSVGGSRSELIRPLLEHACTVIGATSALLVWSIDEEPRVELAVWNGASFQLTREPASRFEPYVDERLATISFVTVKDSGPRIVQTVNGSEILDLSVDAPVHPAIAEMLAPGTQASARFETEQLAGRFVASGLAQATPDVLPVVEIVARELGASLAQIEMHARQRQIDIAEERIRVARDLHDGILQGLTGIRLELQAVARRSDADARDDVRDRLLALERALAIEQRELRLFIEDLKPFVRAAGGGTLVERLEELRERISLEWKVPVALRVSTAPPHLSPEVHNAIPRMVHEAVVNAMKHGQPSRVAVDVRGEPDRVTITVIDDGRGFPFEGRFDHDVLVDRNIGPVSLCERVRSLGGHVTIESGAAGARVEMSLPVVPAQA